MGQQEQQAGQRQQHGQHLTAPVPANASPTASPSAAAEAQPAAAAAAAAAAAGAGPGSASLGGFTAAQLEEVAALEDDEDAWEAVLSPQPARRQEAPGGASAAASPGQPEPGQQAEGQAGEELRGVDVEAQLDALREEERRLKAAQRAGRGQVETPTADMYQDCMELLTMFGVPYIIAPQEAEAQCAWLDGAGLVDGVVTDDNDVFLFGARRVYRHIFESKRYVEEYRSEDLQRELGVGREELGALAQLLGSDYCEGVAGVGIVNAVEVVHAFPGPDGLKEFREDRKSVV